MLNHPLSATPPPPAIKRPIFLAFLAAYLILLAAFFSSLQWMTNRQKEVVLTEPITFLAREFQPQLDREAAALTAHLEILAGIAALRDAFAAGDRERLLQESRPLNASLLGRQEITHFYFHQADGVNFLRVHKPSRHGDLINRLTMGEAMATGRISQGVELGPLGTLTLRVVFPWRHQGEIIGFLELGKEIDHLIGALQQSHDMTLFTVLEKSLLDRESWNSGARMLGFDQSWNRFPGVVLLQRPGQRLPAGLTDYIASGGWMSEDPLQTSRIGPTDQDNRLHFFSLAIRNPAQRTVGWVLGAHDHTEFFQANALHARLVMGVLSGVTLLLGGLVFHQLTRVDARIGADHLALLESRERMTRAQEIARFGNWEWRFRPRRFTSSPGLRRIMAIDPDQEEISPAAFLQQVRPQEREHLRRGVRPLLNGRLREKDLEFRVRRPDGSERILQGRAAMDRDERGRRFRLVITLQDVTEARLAQEQFSLASSVFNAAMDQAQDAVSLLRQNHETLAQQALTDPLTELGNRRFFDETIERLLSQCHRTGQRMAVLLLDLDRFKPINDAHGHDIGDRVLQEFSHRIRSVMRGSDLLFRLGGDEFAVLLPECQGERHAATMGRRIQEHGSMPLDIDGRDCGVGVSIGIALYPEHAQDALSLIKRADQALYQVKHDGRGHFQFFQDFSA